MPTITLRPGPEHALRWRDHPRWQRERFVFSRPGAGITCLLLAFVANSTRQQLGFLLGGGIYNLHFDIANCTSLQPATNGGIYNYSSPSIATAPNKQPASGVFIIFILRKLSPAPSSGPIHHTADHRWCLHNHSVYCIVQNGYAGGTNIIDADPLLLGDHSIPPRLCQSPEALQSGGPGPQPRPRTSVVCPRLLARHGLASSDMALVSDV